MRPILLIAVLTVICATFSSPTRAGTLAGTPATTAVVGKPYSFTPMLPDGATCEKCFRARSLPAWAGFSRRTGTMSGTPTAAGSYSNIRIHAYYKGQVYRLPAFGITVQGASAATAPAPLPVTISGTPPATATVGQVYSFSPTTRAGSNTALTYAITNKPVWSSFNSSNGNLTGTPAAANVASYPGIVIRVSDGTSNASLGPFSITVDAAQTGTVTLSWVAPTRNTDGSALTDLSGYRVYYGGDATSMTSQLTVPASATGASIENLTHGTWYFALSDFNSSGVESARTSTVSMSVN